MDPTLGKENILVGAASKGRPPPSEIEHMPKKLKQDAENKAVKEASGTVSGSKAFSHGPPRTRPGLQARSNGTPIVSSKIPLPGQQGKAASSKAISTNPKLENTPGKVDEAGQSRVDVESVDDLTCLEEFPLEQDPFRVYAEPKDTPSLERSRNNAGAQVKRPGVPSRPPPRQSVAAQQQMEKERFAAAKKSWQTWRSAFATMRNAYKMKLQELKDLHLSLDEETKKLTSLQLEHQKAIADHDEERASLTEQLNEKSASITEFEAKCSSYNSEKDHLSREASALKHRIEEMTLELRKSEQEVAHLKDRLAEVQQHLQNLQQDKEKLYKTVDELKTEKEKQKECLEAQVNTLFQQKSRAEARYFDKDAEICNITANLHRTEIKVKEVEMEKNNAESALELLKNDNKHLQERVDMLVSEKTSAIEELRLQLDEQRAERNRVEQRFLDGQIAAKQVQVQLAQTQERESEAQRKVQQLEASSCATKDNLRLMELELSRVVEEKRKAEADAANYAQEAKEHADKVLKLQVDLERQQEVAAIAGDGEKARYQAKILDLSASLAIKDRENQDMAAKLKHLEEQFSMEKTAKEDALEKTAAKSVEVRQLKNRIQDLIGNIRVVCRARPLNPGEVGGFDGPHATIKIPEKSDAKKISLTRGQEGRTYKFDRVFGPDASQTLVFEEVEQLVQSSMDGFRVCIFSYGQTGSGKTHTMMGSMEGDGQGITPRALSLLFKTKEELEALGWTIKLQASFLEIYNEEINDLLEGFPGAKVPLPGGPWAENNASSCLETAAGNGSGSENLSVPSSQRPTQASKAASRSSAPTGRSGNATTSGKENPKSSRDIHYDAEGNLWVDDLGEVELQSVEQAMTLVKHAHRKRSVGSTEMNAQSSRSHSGLFVTIQAQKPNSNQEEALVGSLTLLDLAGSERLKESKAVGSTRTETNNINKSLSTLMLVLRQIKNPAANGKPNYRDSKLTYLLKSCLEPEKRGKALMFINVSPSESSYEQSKSSLEFASDVNSTQLGEAKRSTRTVQ